MDTTILKIELNSADVSLFKGLLEKFKAKIIVEEKKDDTKMTKDEYFKKIDKALQQAKDGKTVKLDTKNLWDSI